MVSFGTNDPNVGGWGWIVPKLYESLFFQQKNCQIHGKNLKSMKIYGVDGWVHIQKFGSAAQTATVNGHFHEGMKNLDHVKRPTKGQL